MMVLKGDHIHLGWISNFVIVRISKDGEMIIKQIVKNIHL